MSRINRVPRGLQDLLGNINQGENPDELLEGVRAGFDIQPLWLLERLRTRRVTGTNPTNFTQYQITVPTNELWLVRTLAFGASSILAATLKIRASFRLHNLNDDSTPGTNITRIGETDFLDFNLATQEQTGTVQFTPYLAVPPDTIISCFTGYVQNGGASVATNFDVLYYKLNV